MFEKIKKCINNRTLEDMRGKFCLVKLNLSNEYNLSFLSLEFKLEDDKYFIYLHSFIPEKSVLENKNKILYENWINQGLLTVTETLDGVKTDYKYIIAYLKSLLKDYDLKINRIICDPYNADIFLSDLDEFGVEIIAIKSSY